MSVAKLKTTGALVEWIPYVRGARDSSEQNLEAIMSDTTLYYRSTKRVSVGAELLVWYTPELAKTVGVPEIHPAFISGKYSTVIN